MPKDYTTETLMHPQRRDYTYDYNMPPRRATRLSKVRRVRPYDPRRDGAHAKPVPFPYAGGIFGQPPIPRTHTGVFECGWALPDYVSRAEVVGGPLQYETLRADPTMSDPIERGINTPDLGGLGESTASKCVAPLAFIGAGLALAWLVFSR